MSEAEERIARICCFWDDGTCHDAYCGHECIAIRPDARYFAMAKAVLADGVGRAPRPMLNASQVPGTPSNPAFKPEDPRDDQQLPDASGGR